MNLPLNPTKNMSNLTIIKADQAPGGPPPGLSELAALRWAHNNPPKNFQLSFAGKTVLVTGANIGLGFEAANKYAEFGAEKLILAVRNAAKGEEAKKRIMQRTGRKGDSIIILTVDLAEFASVQTFIDSLAKETQHLDIALLNAGVGNPSFEKSSAGWEMAVQVNVLSTALMAIGILPLLRSTAAARSTAVHMTFVNSNGHDRVKEDWLAGSGGSLLRAANDRAKWEPTKSYCMVKLLGMAVMQTLARATIFSESGSPDVIVNAVCPGLCRTNLGRSFGIMSKIVGIPFQAMFARSAEEGARSLVSATALGSESQGRLWHHDILFP